MNRYLQLFASVGVVALAAPGFGQTDLSQRLRPAPGQPKHVRYDMRTRTVRPESGPSTFFGPNKLYNNTCPQPIFIGLSPGNQLIDFGQVPSSTNTFAGVDLSNCLDSYNVNGFQVFYCSNQPSNDLTVTFHELYNPCTDILMSPVTAGFNIGGLPGSSSGGALCYVVDIDLEGTSLEFTMLGDGDGVFGGGSDNFAYTYEFTNITGTAVGPVVAGGSVIVGQGCDWGVDTIFSQGDPTNSAPNGTGWGTTDTFGLQDSIGGMFTGCFFFGGYPQNAYSSFHMVLYTDDECAALEADRVCDGQAPAPCPCGNNSSAGDEGCLNSSGSGGDIIAPPTASISMGGLFVDAVYPAGNGSLLLTNVAGSLISVGTFDGHACVAGGPRVLPGADNGAAPDVTAMDGVRTIGDVWAAMNGVAPGFVVAGTSYDMQAWYRDVLCGPPPAPCPSPCGTNANFTTAVRVLAGP